MADTTNDIWNDRDGEREAPPKRHILRNFLIFLLVLIAVLGVVLVKLIESNAALRKVFVTE